MYSGIIQRNLNMGISALKRNISHELYAKLTMSSGFSNTTGAIYIIPRDVSWSRIICAFYSLTLTA